MSRLTDQHRALVIAASNVLALAVVAIIGRTVSRWLAHPELLGAASRALIAVCVYFVLIAIPRLVWGCFLMVMSFLWWIIKAVALLPANRDVPDIKEHVKLPQRNDRVDFQIPLRVGVVLNFLILACMILLTGGPVQSPLAPFFGVMIALGQMLSVTKATHILLASLGLILYAGVTFIYYRPLLPIKVLTGPTNSFPPGDSGVIISVVSVGVLIIILSTIVAMARKP